MPGGEGAKYINSRETASFKKSQLLYGLHEARPAIGRAGRAIVVEGYTDVIQLHAAGFDNAVAAMGTSLTEEQLRELKRLCGELVLAFDADAAGQDAALRGLRRAEQLEFDVRIVPLPPGQDPADLALRGCGGRRGRARADAPGAGVRARPACSRASGQDDPDAVYRDAARCWQRDPESILRQEQVRRVAGALRLDERLTAGLVRAGGAAAGRRGRRSPSACRSTSRCAASASCSPPRSRRRRRGPRRWPRRRRAATCARAPRSGLLPWVRARLAGSDAPPPEGLEADAAAIVAAAAGYGDAGPAAVRQLSIWLEVGHLERKRDSLKQKAAADEYTQEAQRALVELERRIADLKGRLRAD